MEFRRHADPLAYEALVTPLLMVDEARFNLELAVLGRVARGEAQLDGDPLLVSVHDGGALVGAAMRTPPWKLLIAPVPDTAAAGLARHLDDVELPGVLGSKAGTESFARAYGVPWRVDREQGVYRLRTLVPPRPTTGALRRADAVADADVIVRYVHAFCADARLPLTEPERDLAQARDGRLWLWEDGGVPVCLVGVGGYTPSGARVGPVYTPPEHRGRGYASAATAAVTELLLDRGCEYTFLYTDLANATANKIYRAIGYEHVADVQDVVLGG